MLKKTDVVLHLITDPAMYLMIESGMSGGVCMISKCHAKPNTPKLGNNEPEQPLSYIVHWDAKNLYGCVLSQVVAVNHLKSVAQEN